MTVATDPIPQSYRRQRLKAALWEALAIIAGAAALAFLLTFVVLPRIVAVLWP